MNIKRKFALLAILWGIIPVVISSIVYISNFNLKSNEMIKQNVATSANHQAIILQDFFTDNISNLKSVGNLPITTKILSDSNGNKSSTDDKNNTEILNEILRSKKEEKNFLVKTSLINANNIVLASSDQTDLTKTISIDAKDLEKLNYNRILVTGIKEDTKINNGRRSAVIASPIFFDNKYQGSVVNIIDMSYFKNLVNSIHFFKTGKVAIIDYNGEVAATNSENMEGNISEMTVPNNLYEQWKNIDLDKYPKGLIEYTMGNTEKIGYYSKIDNTGWVVLSGVEWSEFKTPVKDNIISMIIFLVFVIMLVLTVYNFIINHFSRPIYNLIDVIRKIKQGNYEDRYVYSKDDEFGEIATAFNDLIDNLENKRMQIEDKNRDLQSITSNIPGAVHRSKLINGIFHIDFISVGGLELLGYEKHEFDEFYKKDRAKFIYEEDKERLRGEITEQLKESKKYVVEYRIKRKDGNLIWLLDIGHVFTDRDGELYSYNVAINITDEKVAQEELRLSEERYRIVMSQTEEIIFEWNVKDDTIYYSGNWENTFNYVPAVENISTKIFKSNAVHKDDIRRFGKMLNSIITGEKYSEIEVRLRKNDNSYIWCKIRMTAMFDENGNIFKVIGVIRDINKEKTETENLIFKAQRDSLTGLYNKGTAVSIIEEYINKDNLNDKGALFIIDVDNFKWVNDNLGHLAGDLTLTKISQVISEVFIENSIVSRIGGDEFIVFLKDIDSDEYIHKKAKELINGLRENFIDEDLKHKISGSVGIAKYPEHGKSYKELFVNADKAVYLVKNKGKNNYCLFQDI